MNIENKKKAVVIGCGSIGLRYLKILNDLGYFVGCYDLKKINLKIPSSKIIFFDTIESCVNSNPNIIIISTPPNSHLSCLKEAIKSQAKILLEKPLAATKEDANEILKIAEENKGRIWCVANMRYHVAFNVLQQNLSSLGKVYYAISHFSHKLSQMRSIGLNVFASKKDEGGVILDCVHDIDLLFRLFKRLTFQNSWIDSIGCEKIEAEDSAHLWLKGNKGEHISMHLDFLSLSKSRGIKIVGEKGTLIWESHGRNPEIASVKFLGKDGLINSLINNNSLSNNSTYKEMIIDFLNKGKKLQTVKEAYEVLNIALKARNLN